MQYFNNIPYTPQMPPGMGQSQYTIPPGLLNQFAMPAHIPGMTVPNQLAPSQIPPGMMPQEPYTYPQNLPMALQLIREAVSGESEDRRFYEYLINVAPTSEEKKIISGIRDDEISHFGLFRQIYRELTGQTLPPPAQEEFKKPATYCEGLKNAFMGEQGVVPKYRRILFALQNRTQINKLTAIITDELRHASIYNYLYAKNKCTV